MNTINHKVEMLDNNYMFYVSLEIFSDICIMKKKEFMCIFSVLKMKMGKEDKDQRSIVLL